MSIANVHVTIEGGVHRVEAHKRLGHSHVRALLRHIPQERWFAEAVRLNADHGRPLTTQERIQCADRLADQGYTLEQISVLIHMPAGDIERYCVDRVVRDIPGASFTVKSGLVPVKEQVAVLGQEAQEPLSGTPLQRLAHEIVWLIQHELITSDDLDALAELVAVCQTRIAASGQKAALRSSSEAAVP